MDETHDQESYGQESVDRSLGYTPMPAAAAAPRPKPAFENAREAAAELVRERDDDDPPAIERKYVHLDGDSAGEGIERNKTVKLDRAAHDLSELRAAEAADLDARINEMSAQAIDQVRGEARGTAEQIDRPAEVAATEQASELAPQPETPPAIDPEIARALQNPKVRDALQAEVAGAEAARQQYTQAATEAAELAASALYGSFPELRGLNAQQIGGALQVIAAQNPARYEQLRAQLAQTHQLYTASVQAQAAQQQRTAAQFQQFAAQNDAAMERFLKSEPPETVARVKQEIAAIAERDYGVGRDELTALLQSQPVMRTAAFQRMMYDAAKYRLALKSAAERAPPPAPPVMRPGVARSPVAADDAHVLDAQAAFRNNPNPKTAAAVLVAKREARR
ncbi:hypothetical protein [Rhodoplanes sp. Z2-YC6860]|uniref:hypothetical protein n=1 Tax=Rhodoplanes sp. Z2-YC6860 TaxID=674703 RepID=UPI00078DBC87|nr:hypothetical protein [Rhodoplanes sp. Z2-YC6860]AMN43102.1 hypothetical protein RHPLAN_46760 [Rhodoplanes sp. Z2-YC6860]